MTEAIPYEGETQRIVDQFNDQLARHPELCELSLTSQSRIRRLVRAYIDDVYQNGLHPIPPTCEGFLEELAR